jgi:hypothetical protein
MAEKAKEPTVEVPVSVLEKLQARLDKLEHEQRINTEILVNGKAKILDPAYEAWKKEVARPTADRSQDVADTTYGTTGKRFRVCLDSSTEEGKAGPKIGEHPALIVAGNSNLEAQARYLQLCGIRKHDYRFKTELVQAA